MTRVVQALFALMVAGSFAAGSAAAQAPDASGRWDVQLNASDGPHKATLTLKRAKNSSKALWDWHQAVMQGKLGDARRNGSIILKSFDGSEVGRYNFTNAWVSKISTGTLKAGATEMLMEEVSIVTESVERVQ